MTAVRLAAGSVCKGMSCVDDREGGVGGMLWCANAMRCGARGSCSGDRAVCVCKAFGVDLEGCWIVCTFCDIMRVYVIENWWFKIVLWALVLQYFHAFLKGVVQELL